MHERGHVSRAVAEFLAGTGGFPSRIEVYLGPDMVEEVARSAWDEAVAGTPAAGAEVRWIRAADLLQCLVCGCEYPGIKLDPCPECSGNGLVVEAAPEIDIVGGDAPGESADSR